MKSKKGAGSTRFQVYRWLPQYLRDAMALQEKVEYVPPQVISLPH